MRILITGSSGFIGRRVARRLLASGHEVHATVQGARTRPHALPAGAHPIRIDLFDEASTRTTVARVRAQQLIHLAWATDPQSYRDDPFNHTWVRASLNLLESFAEARGQHVFIAGSCAEYDWRTGARLCAGITPLVPQTRYGRCKAALSMMAADYAAAHGLKLAWGRIAFPFGPREHPQRLISALTRALLTGEPARCGPGTVARDFIFVEDLADMIMLIVTQGLTGEFDLGSGQATSVTAIAQHLQGLTHSPVPVQVGALPARPDEPLELWSDATRIRAAGWQPRWGLEAGLARCVASWRRQCAVLSSRSNVEPSHDA